jgi:UDP-glucose 4-epimerase
MAKDKKVLVIGGCGYIGSHMVKCLLESKYEVVVLDDLSTGFSDSLLGGDLVIGDYGNRLLLNELFARHSFDGVLHFAGLIQVGESVLDPARYYQSNVVKTLILLEAIKDHLIPYLIFSSTAAVFGSPLFTPIDETHPCNPINPYGMSKYIVEKMLADFDRAYGLRYVVLRYFNAAGADPNGRIGERHTPETHLIPLVLKAALGKSPLTIFGCDYETLDGTCIRDYVHVDDLAKAHLLALEYLYADGKSDSFNLGNGAGFSIKQIINTVEIVTKTKVNFQYHERREGDPAVLIADATKAKNILGWSLMYENIDTIIKHAWNWERK